MAIELLASSQGALYGVLVWGQGQYGADVYTLPRSLTLRDNSFEVRRDRWELALADGARSEGGEIKDRRVAVEGNIYQGTRAATRALLDRIRYEASRPNLRLRMDSGRFIYLAGLESFSEDPEALWDWQACRLRLQWQCDDPFWYAEQTRSVTYSLSGNTVLSLDGLAGGRECVRGNHPVITLSPFSGESVPYFRLKNLSDEGAQFAYADPGLVGGQPVTINCVDGTVTRGGENTVRYFEGDFIRLITGPNRLEYIGPAATLTIQWRPRWL